VAGVSVTFAGPSSGAGITPALSTLLTNSSGVATLSAAANNTAGSFQVNASVAGVSPAAVSITNQAGGATQLVLVSGGGQSAAVNQAFAAPLVVRANDAQGNPVSGAQISFTAPGAGASAVLVGSPAATNVNGLVSVSATANGTPGSYSVSAAASFGTPVNFSLSNLAAGASALVITAGAGQSGAPGSILSIDPQVRVNDAGGSPVAGVVVSFAVISGGGSVTEALALSDSNGLATVGSWTLGGSLGVNTLRASVVGNLLVTPVVFTATAVGVLDVSISITSGVQLIRNGAIHDHIIVVSNAGPNTASPAAVSVPVPVEHLLATATWICTASGGANCTASGTGNINQAVTLPSGSSVTFTTSATVAQGPFDPITVTATVSAGGDDTPANNSASAVTFLRLFRDGFEDGGTGKALTALAADQTSVLLKSPPSAERPLSWLVGADEQGLARFSLDVLTVGAQTLFRLRNTAAVERSSAWQVWPERGLDLSLVKSAYRSVELIGLHGGQRTALDLGAAEQQLQLQLAAPQRSD